MAIIFDGQTATALGGGSGGQPFQDLPDTPHVLVGILYDCHAFTNDVDEYPGWTIFYKFLNAIVPYYAPLMADGSMGTPVRGTQYGGGSRHNFTASGLLMAPPGYVVTAINVRWDGIQGAGTCVKAFQLAFALWTAQGVSSGMTTLSPWQGGDGQIGSTGSSDYGPGDVNAVPNAPAISTTGSSAQFGAGPGGCMVGLAGRSGDLIDALGGIWAVPRIVSP